MTARPEAAGPSEDLSDLLAALVLAVPGVAALHGGTFGEVATYLPGRLVRGVRLRDGVVEVHVVLLWGASVLGTADVIRATIGQLVPGRVDITIQDVLDQGPVVVPPAPVAMAGV